MCNIVDFGVAEPVIPITVTVKHLKKPIKLTIQISANDFVKRIKEEIFNQCSISIGFQRLLLKGKVLADDKKVSSYTEEKDISLTLAEKEPEYNYPMQDSEFGRNLLKLLQESFDDSQVYTIMQDFNRKYNSWLEKK